MFKNFKKIGALLLTVAMLLSCGAAAFADHELSGTGDDVIVAGQSELRIPKTLVLESSLDKAFIPEIEYSYSIEPATPPAGATVTDDAAQHSPAVSVTSVVTAGPVGGVTLGSEGKVVFAAGEMDKGTLTEYLSVSVEIGRFSKPGIYRYKISDVTDESVLFDAGVTRGAAYAADRYLDIYIHYSASEALEPYGYVLLRENKANVNADDSAKSIGFVEAEEGDTTDIYTTVDISVSKTVTGAMGDLKHEFDFAISVSNNGLSYYAKENAVPAVSDVKDDTSFSVELKNGDVYYLCGLSPKAVVSYTETNDTIDTYQVTIIDNASAIVNSVDKSAAAPGEQQTTGELAVSNYPAADPGDFVNTRVAASDNQAIDFTNNLDEISPTGVVLRVAPYALMLGAGLFLLLLAKRRREEKEEA